MDHSSETTNKVVKIQEESPKPKFYPFWFHKDSGVQLNRQKLVRFLGEQGFGYFQSVDGRTAKNALFKNEEGVLQLHDPNSVKRWVTDFIENDQDLSLGIFYRGDFSAGSLRRRALNPTST